MRKLLLISGVVVMGLAQLGTLASCQTSPVDEEELSTGGAGGSSGGAGGSSGGGGGIGGVPGGESCDGTLGIGGECGVCQVSLDDYCAEHDCAIPTWDEVCLLADEPDVLEIGCGYWQVTSRQRTGDFGEFTHYVDVWERATGDLLYHSEYRNYGACEPMLTAGNEPECNAYGESCDSTAGCFECLSGCAANQGCIYPGDIYTSCAEREAALCGSGGAGGEGGHGGFGGGAP